MPKVTTTYKSHGFTNTPLQLTHGKAALAAGQMEQTFSGDMDGYGVSHFTLLPQDTHKTLFEGVQVFDGTLLGKKGTFASTARGIIVDGVVDTDMVIYEGSGTGELTGIRGTGTSRVTFGQTEGIPMSFEVEFA